MRSDIRLWCGHCNDIPSFNVRLSMSKEVGGVQRDGVVVQSLVHVAFSVAQADICRSVLCKRFEPCGSPEFSIAVINFGDAIFSSALLIDIFIGVIVCLYLREKFQCSSLAESSIVSKSFRCSRAPSVRLPTADFGRSTRCQCFDCQSKAMRMSARKSFNLFLKLAFNAHFFWMWFSKAFYRLFSCSVWLNFEFRLFAFSSIRRSMSLRRPSIALAPFVRFD